MSSITTKYLRLFPEDVDLKHSDKEESNSITNPRNLLDAFISRTQKLADTNDRVPRCTVYRCQRWLWQHPPQ